MAINFFSLSFLDLLVTKEVLQRGKVVKSKFELHICYVLSEIRNRSLTYAKPTSVFDQFESLLAGNLISKCAPVLSSNYGFCFKPAFQNTSWILFWSPGSGLII